MKRFSLALIVLIALLFSNSSFAQLGPAAPSNGIWAILDTSYQVGTSTQGQSQAKVTLQNTTLTKYTGVQFRVFYDNAAFNAASVALIGSSTNLDLQFIDNPAAGYVTVTLVYTGNSSTYTLANGETFLITFTHVQASTFYSLATIAPLTWTGAQTFPSFASTQDGMDTTLSTHNYGGVWVKPNLVFHGNFVNTTGTPAKNLTLALEKKVKVGGTWTQHATYTTNVNGEFSLDEPIDTTYYDVRLAVKGDTLSVGNVISSADAQLINQWVLGGATPSGFDFYTGDVNGSNSITITDAYAVFGRISGRFSAWPNSVKDVKFFTAAEYATITNNPSNNYTSTIPGVTNFYYDIIPGQADSVTYYVMVPGDANGTGYHMARLTPITMLPAPNPNYPSAMQNVVDMNVTYDFPTNHMEITMPSIVVNEGNQVEIPIKVKTFGQNISALQLSLLYDQDLLEFAEVVNSDKSMFWMSSVNPMNGIVEWTGYDPSANKDYMIPDGYTAFTLNFIAKKPQAEWQTAPLYTTRKFSGDSQSKDMRISPTNGILVVAKMASLPNSLDKMVIFPNPTSGEFAVNFTVKQSGQVKLYVMDMSGRVTNVILDKYLSAGKYTYSSNITNLESGIYFATLQAQKQAESAKILKQK